MPAIIATDLSPFVGCTSQEPTTPPTPHAPGGVVEASLVTKIKIGPDGLTPAVHGDKTVCFVGETGPPPSVRATTTKVFFQGHAVARVGDGAGHGASGVILLGDPRVVIGP